MKVLVTGAKGWLGKAVLEVVGRQHEVRAFDRPQVEWPPEPVAWQGEVMEGDIGDYETMRRATQGMDAVVHMAVASHRSHAPYGTSEAPAPAVPFTVNVQGTYNIMDTACRAGARRFILIGSSPMDHLGKKPPFKIHGGMEWMDRSELYGLTKYLQERICWFYATTLGMETLVLRCGLIVDGSSGLTKYGKPLRETDPWDRRNGAWVDRYDMAEAISRALTVEHTGFEILYIIGWKKGEAYFDVERAEQKLGLRYRYRFEEYG
ncbi:MAG: NAD(P)-dependent oxidoreductase [Anaerolineae bacterium]|nr:NAD(P)-dependent oxidoreductase [Anaerolineae bacterium]